MAGNLLGAPCARGVDGGDWPHFCAGLHLRAWNWACVWAPVWGAIVPNIVSKDELPSAITLGGVQLNLSGIVGPALGGLLLPLLDAPLLI